MQSKKFLRAKQLSLIVDVSGLMAGVDEVGRGPLAGPVVAAAVILDERRTIRGLNDSKLLTPATRERLSIEIRAKALCVSIGEATVDEIDRINILQAALLAMRRAVDGLHLTPQVVVVDGNQLPQVPMACRSIVIATSTRRSGRCSTRDLGRVRTHAPGAARGRIRID